MGITTPTDSRSQRIRASRRGGHLLTRALSPSNNTGLPILRVLPDAPVPEALSLTLKLQRAGQRGVEDFILDTNPLERVNKEIGRRSDVVGIYPNDQALIRLAGMLLVEQNDEWLVQRRYLSDHSIRLVLSDAQGSEPTRRIDNNTEVITLNAA